MQVGPALKTGGQQLFKGNFANPAAVFLVPADGLATGGKQLQRRLHSGSGKARQGAQTRFVSALNTAQGQCAAYQRSPGFIARLGFGLAAADGFCRIAKFWQLLQQPELIGQFRVFGP